MPTQLISVSVPTTTARAWVSDPNSPLPAEERAVVQKALDASNGAASIDLKVPKSWASRADAVGAYVQEHGAVAAHLGRTRASFAAPTLVVPPGFPTADNLSGKVKETPMPPEAVAFVKKMMVGEEHSRWHTTRDFTFTMQELTPATAGAGPVIQAWKDLRAAGLGVPQATPPAGFKPDPKQTAFLAAMKTFVASSAKSKDPNVKDVVSTWNQIQKQNWPVPSRQEGDPGNGLDFLTMHHEMILMMKHQLGSDPTAMAALNGWSNFPTPAPWPYDPSSSTAGVGKATTAVNLLNELMQANTPAQVAQLKTDFKNVTNIDFDAATPDQFGLWIQSSAAGIPNSGIHNWMHNQYEVPKSAVEMDSFVLNVQNPHFWGLHGTIDNAFMKFLSLHGMSVDSAPIKADLAQQAAEMGMMVQPESGQMAAGKMGAMNMSCPPPKLDAEGNGVLPDGSKIPSFDKMSPELKDVLQRTQDLSVQRGLMK